MEAPKGVLFIFFVLCLTRSSSSNGCTKLAPDACRQIKPTSSASIRGSPGACSGFGFWEEVVPEEGPHVCQGFSAGEGVSPCDSCDGGSCEKLDSARVKPKLLNYLKGRAKPPMFTKSPSECAAKCAAKSRYSLFTWDADTGRCLLYRPVEDWTTGVTVCTCD